VSEALGASESRDRGGIELELWQLELRYALLRIRHRAWQRRLAASLLGQGQQSPVVVVAAAQADRYVLMDGYGRVDALRELGRDTVWALLLPLSEAQALVIGYRLDTGRRRTALEEGWLIRELVETHGRKLLSVGVELGRGKSWASRRLGLVRDLPERVQELVREGCLCPYAAMRSLLPLARANGGRRRDECVQLGEVAAREGLSARQLDSLCRAWRAASAQQREQLGAEPLVYLKVDEAIESTSRPERREPSGQPRLVRDLEVLVSVSRRAEGLLRGHGGRADELGESAALVLVWPRAREAFEALTRQVEARLDAGFGDTDSGLAPAP